VFTENLLTPGPNNSFAKQLKTRNLLDQRAGSSQEQSMHRLTGRLSMDLFFDIGDIESPLIYLFLLAFTAPRGALPPSLIITAISSTS